MTIFKAYDIRGVYPTELDEELAKKIGTATANYLSARTLVVGRDIRMSAPSMAKALINGINEAGTNVVDIGICTTPMVYFAIGKYGYDGGIMVTASHNPPEYIGFKISRAEAVPLGKDTGIGAIEEMVKSGQTAVDSKNTGISVQKRDISDDYTEHIVQKIKSPFPLKIAIDTANGVTGTILPKILNRLPFEWTPLFFEPDGNFPNHEPNPLEEKNLTTLKKTVVDNNMDLGIAFDGDGDRCIFVDDKGIKVSCDLITALLAEEYLKEFPGQAVIYDLRSSWIVREEIERLGGKPIRERVGHAFMKKALREANGIFGGELSGHFYFREHFFCDSGIVAMAKVLSIVCKRKQKLSELLQPFRRYFSTGELNFKVLDKDAMITKISEVYNRGKVDFLDGITVEFDDWWFNVRKSNTEPLLRLNLEARTKERMMEKQTELSAILHKGK